MRIGLGDNIMALKERIFRNTASSLDSYLSRVIGLSVWETGRQCSEAYHPM